MNETANNSRTKRIVILLMPFLFIGLAFILWGTGTYFYLFGAVDNFKTPLTLIVAPAIIITIVCARKRCSKIIITVIALVVLCSFHLFDIPFFTVDSTYYEVQSPEGNQSIVVEEWTWLMGGGSSFYLKTNPLFVKKLPGNLSNEGIKHGAPHIEWKGNSVWVDDGYEQILIPLD